MEFYASKHATAEQIAEIEKLAADGHKDALMAFGQDCSYVGAKRMAKYSLVAFSIGIVVAGIESGIRNFVQKRRIKKKIEELNERIDQNKKD